MPESEVKPQVELKYAELKPFPAWCKIFGKTCELFLEIGIGNGEFVEWLGKNHPEKCFLGVEVNRLYFKKAVNRIKKADLNNVKLLHAEGSKVLCKLFAPSTLSGLYLNFPDPWVKKKQKKRRLVNEFFPWLLQSRLKVGGFFLMVTDYQPYAEEVIEFFSKCKAFVPLWDSRPIKNEFPNYYHTKYARKWLSQGLPLFYVGFKKVKHLEIPEEVLNYYPILRLEGDEALPAVVIKVPQKVSLSEITFPEGVVWRDKNLVVKILEVFKGKNSILLDILVSEGSLLQRFFVVIATHPDGLIVKVHDSELPDPTKGVHTAISILAAEVLKSFPQAKVVQNQCKSSVFNNVLKSFQIQPELRKAP